MKKIYFAVIIIFVASLAGCGNAKNIKSAKTDEFIFSTIVTQTVYGDNCEIAAKNVNDTLYKLEGKLSIYNKDSEVSKINENAGISPVKVDDYTFELIKLATRYSEESNGLFDITVAPLSKLWGIDTSSPHIPTKEELSAILPLINYENIVFDEQKKTIFLKEKNMAIDLGGVAKGYFIDIIKSEYEKQDITSAICSIGGNIFTYKKKPDGSEYVLGIRDPLDENSNSYMGTLKSSDETVATTGKYERFFEKDGIKYHHVLDLKTGFPSESELLSVTVISKNGGLADFLSTTLFLAGPSAIYEYLNHEAFSVIVIDSKNQIYCSDNIKDKFTITDNKYILINE